MVDATEALLLASGFGPSPAEMVASAVVPGEATDGAVTKVKRVLVDAIALLAVCSGLVTLLVTEGRVVTAAAFATAVFGPYAACQKRQLARLGGFRGQHNRLRGEVNGLMAENDKLTANVNELDSEVDKLEEVEAKLGAIAGNRDNADRMVAYVKKNRELINKIKDNLARRVIHDIMTVLMRGDRDQDFSIGPKEMDVIIFNLNNIEGVDFNEDLFLELVKTHGDKYGKDGVFQIDGAMRVIRNLLSDDVPPEFNVFNIRTDVLRDNLRWTDKMRAKLSSPKL